MPGESQSNGMVEVCGKAIRGMTRTLLFQIEHNKKTVITNSMDIYKWAVRWAAMLINKFKTGKDGQTSHERLGLRRNKSEIIPFGERSFTKQEKTLANCNHNGDPEHIWDSNAWATVKSCMGTMGSKYHGTSEEKWIKKNGPDQRSWQ